MGTNLQQDRLKFNMKTLPATIFFAGHFYIKWFRWIKKKIKLVNFFKQLVILLLQIKNYTVEDSNSLKLGIPYVITSSVFLKCQLLANFFFSYLTVIWKIYNNINLLFYQLHILLHYIIKEKTILLHIITNKRENCIVKGINHYNIFFLFAIAQKCSYK